MKSHKNFLLRGACAFSILMSLVTSTVVSAAVTYTIGGSVKGLGPGKSVTLRNNKDNTLVVSANGTFTFTEKQVSGSTYSVWVWDQPKGQTCKMDSNTGTVRRSNVTSIKVTCTNHVAATYTVSGTLTGLNSGNTISLQNNGGNNLTRSANGAFTFSTSLVNGAPYSVSVLTQPAGQNCTVTHGSGTINSASVTNVGVACSNVVVGAWSNFTLGTSSAGKATLTLFASEPLLVNAPFFGLEVRMNNVDITDDIVNIETLSSTSWRYTFGTRVLNTPGATLNVSLKNTAVASPGHYVAVRGYGQVDDVQSTYQMLLDCQNGVGECAGKGTKPGLLAAIKGLSSRYNPRDIETRASGSTVSTYDFSPIFNDAAFLASKGMKLNVIFTFKSFGKNTLQNGNGSNRVFDIPLGKSGWDKERGREIHVYVKNSSGVWNEVPFQFNSTRTQVVLNTAPPAGTDNVNVVYSRDPFPEYVWHMNPPIAGWYNGAGGQNNDSQIGGGSHGHVYAPWRATTVEWLRNFMAAFQQQWNDAIAAGGLPADAIESVTTQETANALSLTDPTYTPAGYRAGLFELGKFNARAVRRKALFMQMFNMIPEGNRTQEMAKLANEIIPWGGGLGGPDLFNHELALENNVYPNVHRAFNAKALTMIWQQNASYAEKIGTTQNFYTPAQQFIKAQRGVNDSSTPSGTLGLQAEYMYWNMTTEAPQNSPLNFVDHALPVIANNPVVQTSGNDRYLWRRATNGTPILDQSLTKTNP